MRVFRLFAALFTKDLLLSLPGHASPNHRYTHISLINSWAFEIAGRGAGQSSHPSPNSSAAVFGTGPETGKILARFLAIRMARISESSIYLISVSHSRVVFFTAKSFSDIFVSGLNDLNASASGLLEKERLDMELAM
jgi:hypothetical protein